jgi:tRNA threonylcarbamoyl adenosine modification protein YjeE
MTTAVTESEAETSAIGRDLARHLRVGVTVLLEGPLGAGKTAFARGLAEGLGAAPEDVSSPTFTLVQEYRGRQTLRHVDLYRLSPPEVEDLGLDEMLQDGALVVEWPDRWHLPPANAIRVAIAVERENTRTIRIDGVPAASPGAGPARAYSTR